MISITQEPFTEERTAKVKLWLVSPESQDVEKLVKGQIAELISQSGNTAMKVAVGVLQANDVPTDCKDKIAAAATLELFLVTLDHLRKQDTFYNVSLKVE